MIHPYRTLAAIALLSVSACSTRAPADRSGGESTLPTECSSYVSALEGCLRASGLHDAPLASRVAEARQSLEGEASREPSALASLGRKCEGAHARLAAACH